MLTEKFFEVISKEGVVSIVSWSDGDAHVVNTWNSYLVIKDKDRILIPAYAMHKTEKNILKNNKVKLTLGSKEVMGLQYQGAGFLIDGIAKYIESGKEYDEMKSKFSFLTRVLEVKVISAKQTL